MKKTIFNHNLDSVLRTMQAFGPELPKGFEFYSGRPLGITQPKDIIQLPDAIRPGWDWVTRHYERIRLPHTKQVIWNDDFRLTQVFGTYRHSFFLFGPKTNEVHSNEQWLAIVNRMNSKNAFIDLCHELGLPIPETKTYRSSAECAYEGPFPVYLKTDTSASGVGVVLCKMKIDLDHYLGEVLAPQIPFQLQQPVEDGALWLNLTYEVKKGKPVRLAATKQVLKGFVHNGNQFPTGLDVDPWGTTDPLAEYMAENGMKGTFGFDLAMTSTGPVLIECNPRYNGSVYPTIIAQKLGVPEWKAMNFCTKSDNFEDIRLGDLEFNPDKKEGAVVFNWGPLLSEKKIGILLAGDEKKQARLEEELKKVL